ncbi:MAG TPA: RraA family protein [Planococcus sp. (in: firmicutes)]|nr:RraA family protein [Planococcus sp. (in: firmicutes)]
MTDFKGMPTTSISDCTNGFHNMEPAIKPLKDGYRVCGKAFTVQIPVGDSLGVLRAIREAEPGDVLVIDGKGDLYRAVAGDFVVGLAKTLGIAGMVIDGVIRDINGIEDLDFPVFCKGTTVASASSKSDKGETGSAISCGGTIVHPGDIIVGDRDGVVVVAKEDAETILKQTKAKVAKDLQRDEKISGSVEETKAYLDKMLNK